MRAEAEELPHQDRDAHDDYAHRRYERPVRQRADEADGEAAYENGRGQDDDSFDSETLQGATPFFTQYTTRAGLVQVSRPRVPAAAA